jgi:hypothetical protein
VIGSTPTKVITALPDSRERPRRVPGGLPGPIARQLPRARSRRARPAPIEPGATANQASWSDTAGASMR